jgi:tyrosine-specific transport protein
MKSSAETPTNSTVNRFWGATALVSGTTIGAGVLALPSVTTQAGLIPSSIGLIFAWLYALSTGLLLAEIHLRTLEQNQTLSQASSQTLSQSSSLGLISLITPVLGSSRLGQIVRWVAAAAYGFLHYALLVAYVAQGGAILSPLIRAAASIVFVIPTIEVPADLGPIAFVTLLGGFLYFGRPRWIDRVNAIFIGILSISFLGLISSMIPQVDIHRVWVQNWAAVPAAIPIMLVAIFFQNVIPVVTTQLEGNVQQIRRSLFLGSLFPLVLYLLWNGTVLLTLKDSANSLGLTNSSFWVSLFSEVAIATSFIGFVYGLLNFFNDVFLIEAGDVELNPNLKRSLYLLVLAPSLIIAVLNPNIFLSALGWAGTFSISILGGVLPALMAWQQRRELQEVSQIPALVPGGRLSLGIIGAIGLLILGRVAN